MGKATNNDLILFRVDSKFKARIYQIAKKRGKTVSVLLRELVSKNIGIVEPEIRPYSPRKVRESA